MDGLRALVDPHDMYALCTFGAMYVKASSVSN